MLTHKYQTSLCCQTASHLNIGRATFSINIYRLKSFTCILLVGKSEKTSQSDSTRTTTNSKAFCISGQECFVRTGKTHLKLSSSQTTFQLTPSRQCTKLTAQPVYYCFNRDSFTSTLPSGKPNLFCTTAVSSRMRRPFSPRTF